MRFEILGPLRVTDRCAEIDLGGPKQQRVLASLLAAPFSLSVDRLMDEVWGEQPPATASHVVRTYISNLRRVLGDRIVSDGHHYGLDTCGDTIDASDFAGALEDARAAFPAHPEQTAALLEEAESLWRGRPFGELATGTSFIDRRAAELEELRVQSCELLVAAKLAMGLHEQVIPGLEVLTREHPLHEGLHHHLMLALYRSARQAEALRAGWDLRHRLAEEFGIEPSAGIRSLEDRILVQDPGLEILPGRHRPGG
jgi:DNA-binding SARP family transcriptional activator